jgi:hypothetical protein
MSRQKRPRLDYFFIETNATESELDWRCVCEEMLAHLWEDVKPNWWYPFTIGPVVTFASRSFRAFRCPAGSVTAHLYVQGTKRPLSRALLLLSRRADAPADGPVIATLIENGREESSDGAVVLRQLEPLRDSTA